MRQACATIAGLEPASPQGAPLGAPSRASRAPRRAPAFVVDGTQRLADELAGSVMLLGNFDGFHRGHRALLAQARRLAGDALLSVMSVEPHPRQFFNPDLAPFRLSTRRVKQHLFARGGFSFVFGPRFDRAFADQSAEAFVEHLLVGRLRVAHLVVGEDFRFGHRRRGDVALLQAMGAEHGFAVSPVAPVRQQELVCSSSLVRDLLRAGDVAGANEVLGAPWRVDVGVTRRPGGLGLDWPEGVLRLPDGDYRARLVDMATDAAIGAGTLAIRGAHTTFRPDRPVASLHAPHSLALDITGQE